MKNQWLNFLLQTIVFILYIGPLHILCNSTSYNIRSYWMMTWPINLAALRYIFSIQVSEFHVTEIGWTMSQDRVVLICTFVFPQLNKRAIMNIARSPSVLLLAVLSSSLFFTEGAKDCETQLLHGCISRYRVLLKGKPSPEQHCSRIQVSQVILQKLSFL